MLVIAYVITVTTIVLTRNTIFNTDDTIRFKQSQLVTFLHRRKRAVPFDIDRYNLSISVTF